MMWSSVFRTIASRLASGKRASILIVAGLSLGAVGAVTLFGTRAFAERVTTALPNHLVVGPPSGATPMARVDASRTGSVAELPDNPHELWREVVRGGIEAPVVSAENGALVVATSAAELVQLSASGKEQWRVRLGLGAASASPSVLSDGTRVVVTALGEAWGFGASGIQRFRADLSHFGRDARAAPLPLDNNTVVIALGTNLIVLSADGLVLRHGRAEEPLVGSLATGPLGTMALTESGKVLVWSPPIGPRVLGTLRGVAREGMALDRGTRLFAIVDHQRLCVFDLNTAVGQTTFSIFGLEGPPAIDARGVAYATTYSGLLVGVSSHGDVLRIPLDTGASDGSVEDAGITWNLYTRYSPPVIVDRSGRIAYVRPDGRFGVVSRGRSSEPKRLCPDPTSLVAGGAGKVIVACRGGSIWMFGP